LIQNTTLAPGRPVLGPVHRVGANNARILLQVERLELRQFQCNRSNCIDIQVAKLGAPDTFATNEQVLFERTQFHFVREHSKAVTFQIVVGNMN
jgi:hypothetical protein